MMQQLEPRSNCGLSQSSRYTVILILICLIAFRASVSSNFPTTSQPVDLFLIGVTLLEN